MKIAVTAAALILAGCASTDIVTMGNGNFSVTATAQRGFGSSRQEATDNANEYCGKLLKTAIISGFSDSGPHGLSGYSTSVVFHCQ